MIYIDWVTELIDNIPYILSYVIYGYIFLSSYYWISFKDNNNFDNLIIKSVAASYILKTLSSAFCEKLYTLKQIEINSESSVYIIVFSVICALLGFICGKIVVSKWFNDMLHNMHIGRTTNSNIWDDVIKPKTWVRVFMEDGTSYLGQYRYGESFEREPIIVLATWQKLDQDSDVILDYTQSKNDLIMVNTKDFDRIEIVYQDSI